MFAICNAAAGETRRAVPQKFPRTRAEIYTQIAHAHPHTSGENTASL
jgi:hypothetical protein